MAIIGYSVIVILIILGGCWLSQNVAITTKKPKE